MWGEGGLWLFSLKNFSLNNKPLACGWKNLFWLLIWFQSILHHFLSCIKLELIWTVLLMYMMQLGSTVNIWENKNDVTVQTGSNGSFNTSITYCLINLCATDSSSMRFAWTFGIVSWSWTFTTNLLITVLYIMQYYLGVWGHDSTCRLLIPRFPCLEKMQALLWGTPPAAITWRHDVEGLGHCLPWRFDQACVTHDPMIGSLLVRRNRPVIINYKCRGFCIGTD